MAMKNRSVVAVQNKRKSSKNKKGALKVKTNETESEMPLVVDGSDKVMKGMMMKLDGIGDDVLDGFELLFPKEEVDIATDNQDDKGDAMEICDIIASMNAVVEKMTTIPNTLNEAGALMATKDDTALTAVIAENLMSALSLSDLEIEYKEYEFEHELPEIMNLIECELSEPYSLYTYRYFAYTWPKLCLLAKHGDKFVGALLSKFELEDGVKCGYIGMLSVHKSYRKHRIGTTLVNKIIEAMVERGVEEISLETETDNVAALRLYENFGFIRERRLSRYYQNGSDAWVLKLCFK